MRYVCQICGYVYDDAKEKVPFASLPDTWKCPLCGAAKADFKPEEPVKAAEPVQAAAVNDADLKQLTPGQIAAICSNLAKGCEKQYKAREAGLYMDLAAYFSGMTPNVEEASLEKIAAMLQQDIDSYAGVRATADAAGDRGAARSCVWGEKVTRMLASLVNRYLQEGEQMLEHTGVYVCTVCGFVYVGDKAPELCPVCKVPDWKFEKIDGRVSG